MRLQTSFALLVLPFVGALTLTGCPGPDGGSSGGWASNSCYCDETGCRDYNDSECTPGSSGGLSSSSSGWAGSSGASSGSSGIGSSSGGSSGEGDGGSTSSGSSGGSSGTSSGEPDGGSTSSSGGSSGASSSGDIDAGPAPNCSSDGECGTNQTCSEGYCRFQCLTDNECKLFDSRLDFCDQGICRAD